MSRPVPGECPSDSVLLLRLLGLVDEDEAARLDEHIRACPRCEPRLAALRHGEPPPEFPLPPGHVPPAVLARWPGVRSSLPEHAALAVERHLARCAECAGDLARLERIREAPVDVEEEFSVSGARSAEVTDSMRTRMGTPGRFEVEPDAMAPPQPRRSRRGTLLLGGYAAFATAAAIALALREPLTERPQAPRLAGDISSDVVLQPGAPPTTGAPTPGSASGAPQPRDTPPPGGESPPPAAIVPSWQVRLLPREPRPLPSVMRGDATASTVLERGSDPGVLVVRIDPPLSITDDTPITLELRHDNARVLARTRARGADFHGGGTVLLSMGGPDLPAGSYTLRLRTSGSGEAEVIDYPFVLGARE